MAIAPDGTWLATSDGIFSGGTVRIWDTQTKPSSPATRTG